MADNFYNFGKESELVAGANNLSSLVSTNYAACGLTSLQATTLATLVGNLNAKYHASIEPVRVHDADSPTRRGKAPGTAAAFVYTFVGASYPADPGRWKFEGSTSRPKYEITFPNELPGGTQVWIRAAWVNAKQQTGPVSAPITTYLQGGGSSSQEGQMSQAA